MGRKAKAIERKDQLSISLRRNEYKKVVKQVVDEAPGKDVTDKIIHALRFFNRKEGRKDRTYREDEPEKSNYKDYIQGDSKMRKDELISFIRDQWGDPDFNHVDKPLEDTSEAFLKGYVSTRLDVDMDAIEDGGLQYLRGLLEASSGKVDSEKLKRDSKQDLRKDSDDSKADQNQRELGEMYSQRVKIQDSELKQKVESGELTRAEALREELKDMHTSGNPKPGENQSQAEANKEKLQNMHEER